MAFRLTHDAPAPFEGCKVHHWRFDSMSELADMVQSNKKYIENACTSWAGGHTREQAILAAREGDMSAVAESDAMLAEMEQYELATVKARWIDDVAGSIANVPAFIAGHPLSMRRKVRASSDAAPLAIIADLSTSAGITSKQARIRGISILALVRALSQRRPVELWLTAGLGADSDRNACFITVKVDTAPLDLAHAAHALSHVGFPRHLLYGLGRGEFNFYGGWPFSGGALTRQQMEACLAPAFTHVTETLCLPGIHVKDPCLEDPKAWLAKQISDHDPIALSEAAA